MVNRGEEKVRESNPKVVGSIHRSIPTVPRVVPCFPLLGLAPSGLFMGLSSTLIYTSELILSSTIQGHSQPRCHAKARSPSREL